jgi:hypothetical protein
MVLVANTIATELVLDGAGLGIVFLSATAYVFWRRTPNLTSEDEADHG